MLSFEEIAVSDLDVGPRVSERQRTEGSRSPAALTRAIRDHEGDLRACYRWARFKSPDLQGALQLSLVVDPWGIVRQVHPEVLPQGGHELAACVADLLQGQRIDYRFTLRTTRLIQILNFRLSGQKVPQRQPARPQGGRKAPSLCPKNCARVPTADGEDRAEGTPFEIDDFDQDQECQEQDESFRKQNSAWLKTGRQGFAATKPPCIRMLVGQPSGGPPGGMVDKARVAEEIGFNLGAYRHCYSLARARDPALEGVWSFMLSVDSTGAVCEAKLARSAAPDEALGKCLQEALQEVWFEDLPLHGGLTVDVPLHLSPALPDQRYGPMPADTDSTVLNSWAKRALEQGDGRGASVAYNALLQAAAKSEDRCALLAGQFLARLARYPWVDSQVLQAAGELVANTREQPGDPGIVQCLDDVWDPLVRLATKPHILAKRGSKGFLTVAVERYQMLLLAQLPVAKAAELHFYMAEALFDLDRSLEAAQQYTTAVKLDPALRWLQEARLGLLLALKDSFAEGPRAAAAWEACLAQACRNLQSLWVISRTGEEDCQEVIFCAMRLPENEKASLVRFLSACQEEFGGSTP